MPVEGAENYHLEVRDAKTDNLALDRRSEKHYVVLEQPFPAGDYE
ncbi:MAG: hypothetical protein ABEH66_07055 [Halobacteriales archaeon]